ncbi:uncharacterized protein LOC123297448 isoform X1 [Chrysoperla carnea]|uniref:uncharacterized protein LOC123297448 isoform X1 n=1 Tax=Chrysoperla carnea TaxID=189513 RepID=UPI001D0753B2|nr:uncharacterized protein LOC123297448 isoform X1 [Chrysoperla carnea]
MSSLSFIKIIVGLIFIGTAANGNLITLKGRCPFVNVKPSLVNITPFLNGVSSVTFNSIAETAPLSGINRTDITVTMEQPIPGIFKYTKRFRSKETGQCAEFLIFMKAANQPGFYDMLYQVAPNTNFVKYSGYFLAIDPKSIKSIGMACHNLPNSQYQIEVAVLSTSTSEYDKVTQEEVKNALEFYNLGYLYQYIVGIENNDKCK